MSDPQTIHLMECKPRVYLTGHQVVNEAELDRFLADEEVSGWSTDAEVGGEKLIEVAGRLCYMSFARPRPGGNRAYIGHILGVGHGSVLEHEVYNLIITGVDRSFTHELVRHRVGFGYSQLSQRFVDGSGLKYVVHPGLEPLVHWFNQVNEEVLPFEELTKDQAAAAAAFAEWMLAIEACHKAYFTVAEALAPFIDAKDKTLARKRANEAARSILPNATETKVFVTGNARALRHFVEMRGGEQADLQIRRVALELLKVLKQASPHVFGDYVVTDDEVITTPHRKV